MANDFDMRDILLEAQAEFSEIMRDVMGELAMPQMIDALRMQWMTIPDEAKEMLKQQNPGMYKQIVEQMTT
jgi:hypothetical protein